MSTATKRKLPEWIQKYEEGDYAEKLKAPRKREQKSEREKGLELTLAKARLAMNILAEIEENEKEWEQDKIAMDGGDSFAPHFDLEHSPLMDCMEVEDVLEIISKVKGHSYTRDYPHMNDREALMSEIDECFVHYCNKHGIRVQY